MSSCDKAFRANHQFKIPPESILKDLSNKIRSAYPIDAFDFYGGRACFSNNISAALNRFSRISSD